MSKWVTVWGNATSVAERRAENYAKDITLRYLVKSAFGGDKLRLAFSNFCGTEAVTLTSVTVSNAIGEREVDLKGAAQVTFGGKESVIIEAGDEIFSDEISFRVKPLGTLAVSIYLKEFTLMRSAVVVNGPLSKGFFSTGNQTHVSVLPLDKTRTLNTYYFLTGLDVLTDDDKRAVICYGDSITSQSWPDYLAELCMNDPYNHTAIVRRAASGTRILREYNCITYESYGLCGKNRFQREISTVSGADAVIIQQGINDIIHPVGTDINPFRPMSDLPTEEQLVGGIKYYADIAEKFGLKVYLGTLLPIYGWRTYAAFREDLKNGFNQKLRAMAKENCIDFGKALCSDEDVRKFRAEYNCGDNLHPSEDGYKAMAKLAYGYIK